MMGFSRRRKGVLGGAEGEPWWERWVEGTTVIRSLETPAWGAGKDQEGVRRREPRHRLAREQGPPSPSAGLAEKRLDGHPPGRAAAAQALWLTRHTRPFPGFSLVLTPLD